MNNKINTSGDGSVTQVMNAIKEEPIDLKDYMHNDPISRFSDWLYRNIIGPIVGFFEDISAEITARWVGEEIAEMDAEENRAYAARRAQQEQALRDNMPL